MSQLWLASYLVTPTQEGVSPALFFSAPFLPTMISTSRSLLHAFSHVQVFYSLSLSPYLFLAFSFHTFILMHHPLRSLPYVLFFTFLTFSSSLFPPTPPLPRMFHLRSFKLTLPCMFSIYFPCLMACAQCSLFHFLPPVDLSLFLRFGIRSCPLLQVLNNLPYLTSKH